MRKGEAEEKERESGARGIRSEEDRGQRAKDARCKMPEASPDRERGQETGEILVI